MSINRHYTQGTSVSQISIRELLKCTEAAAQDSASAPRASDAKLLAGLRTICARVYAARFRTSAAQSSVLSAIQKGLGHGAMPSGAGASSPSTASSWSVSSSKEGRQLAVGDLSITVGGVTSTGPVAQRQLLLSAGLLGSPLPQELLQFAAACHLQAEQLMTSKYFVERHGVYPCSTSLLVSWVQGWAAVPAGSSAQDFALAGWRIYAAPLRHATAQELLRDAFQGRLVGGSVVSLAGLPASGAQQQPSSASTVKPIALTARMLHAWAHLADARRGGQPVLVTGSAGCGKAAAVQTFTTILNQSLSQYQLTPGRNAQVPFTCFTSCAWLLPKGPEQRPHGHS